MMVGSMILLRAGVAVGQIETDSVVPISYYVAVPEHRLHLAFEHVLSLYDWQASTVLRSPLATDRSFGYDFEFGADSRLRQETGLLTTSVTTTLGAQQRLDDDGLLIPFARVFGTSYAASTPPGSLPPPSLIRRQVDGFAVGGLNSHIPGSSFVVSTGAGLARQSQPYSSTYGAIVLAGLDSVQQPLSDSTLLFAEGSADERFFRERGQRYSNDRLGLRTLSVFGEGHNVAALSASLGRRDFYYPLDSTNPPAKQERRELGLVVMDSVRAPLFRDDVSGVVSLELEPRSITRHSDVPTSDLIQTSSSALSTLLVPNEVASFRITSLAAVDLVPTTPGKRSVSAHAELRYEERSEDVRLISSEFSGAGGSAVRKFTAALEQASFSSKVTSAALASRYAVSARDTLALNAMTRLLNYDTPSEDNHDDHDELTTGLELTFGHALSDNLNAAVGIHATRHHLVYLKSDRSSQNNVTRSLAFTTAAVYRGFAWMNAMNGEVFANYTVLDYFDSLPILQSVGSYVIRGFSLHDTLRIEMGRTFSDIRTGMETTTDLRVSERGSYNIKEFSEHRSTRVTELTALALLALDSWQGQAPWSLKGGVKGFFLYREGESTGSLLSGEKFGELERQSRFGPYLQLDLFRADGRGPALRGALWYSALRSQQSTSGTVYLTQKLESHLEAQWVF